MGLLCLESLQGQRWLHRKSWAAQRPCMWSGRGVQLHNHRSPHRATYPGLPAGGTAGGTGARLPRASCRNSPGWAWDRQYPSMVATEEAGKEKVVP